MVIQRWQSVLLFFAGLAVCLFAFLPVCEIIIPDEILEFSLRGLMPLLVIDMLAGLMLFISIFLYKDLRLQKRITLVSIFLTVIVIGVTAAVIATFDGELGVVWRPACALPVGAFVLSVWAYFMIKSDERLLRSYDRIR